MHRAFHITAAPTVAVMLVRCGAHRITAPMRNAGLAAAAGHPVTSHQARALNEILLNK